MSPYKVRPRAISINSAAVKCSSIFRSDIFRSSIFASKCRILILRFGGLVLGAEYGCLQIARWLGGNSTLTLLSFRQRRLATLLSILIAMCGGSPFLCCVAANISLEKPRGRSNFASSFIENSNDIVSVRKLSDIASVRESSDIASAQKFNDIASVRESNDIVSVQKLNDIASAQKSNDIVSSLKSNNSDKNSKVSLICQLSGDIDQRSQLAVEYCLYPDYDYLPNWLDETEFAPCAWSKREGILGSFVKYLIIGEFQNLKHAQAIAPKSESTYYRMGRYTCRFFTDENRFGYRPYFSKMDNLPTPIIPGVSVK